MASCMLRVRITIEYQLQVQYFTFSVQNVLNSLYDGWITTAGLAFTKHFRNRFGPTKTYAKYQKYNNIAAAHGRRLTWLLTCDLHSFSFAGRRQVKATLALPNSDHGSNGFEMVGLLCEYRQCISRPNLSRRTVFRNLFCPALALRR
jgi:hypothetical protein